MALFHDATGAVIGFWHIAEPEIAQQFEGATGAYFEVEGTGEGETMRVLRRVPDQTW